MFGWLIGKMFGITPKDGERLCAGGGQHGQICYSCCHFIDYFDPTEDPEDCDGYCSADLALGRDSEYGGHWTHSESWCRDWSLFTGDNGWGTRSEKRSADKTAALEARRAIAVERVSAVQK